MYKHVKLPLDDRFMGLRILKDVTRQENQEIVNLIQKRSRKNGPVRLLVAYEADHGLIAAEDLYDNLRFAKQVNDKIDKMAVIGKHAGDSTWIGLFGLFGRIQTNYYENSQVEAAIAWLHE